VIDQPLGEENNELEQLQYLQMIVEVRQKAFMQIVYGLLWWSGSAIAMYFALSTTGDSVYWFGGALGSLFHWYRAFRMINATHKAGAKPLIKKEAVLIGVTAFLVIFSTATIVPEYFRIDSPTIGTCWGDVGKGYMAPVACWSSSAVEKTMAFADIPEECPSSSSGYLDPMANEPRITCLEKN
jgi:hypothetical protein